MKEKDLIRLLEESHSDYSEVGTQEIVRMRAERLTLFQYTGVSKKGLPFLLSELQNSKHPYLLAGAAIGLRGQRRVASGTAIFLVKALRNLAHGDEYVFFRERTTAFAEIIKTLRWYGGHAACVRDQLVALRSLFIQKEANEAITETIVLIDNQRTVDTCCTPFEAKVEKISKTSPRNLREVMLEDQKGRRLSYEAYITGEPCVIAFFYTRCENPQMCSLTVSKVAKLQNEVGNTRIALITYDCMYDTPQRMENYCMSRGVILSDRVRCFRVVEGMEELRSYFSLGVNYFSGIVNNHTIELYITDKKGKLRYRYNRLQWEPLMVAKRVQSIVKEKLAFQGMLSGVLYFAVLFFPKCPFCWAAYLSAFGVSSASVVPFFPGLKYIVMAGLAMNLYIHWKLARRRRSYFPFSLAISSLVMISIYLFWNISLCQKAGLALLILASLLNAIPLNLLRSRFPLKLICKLL